MRSGSLALQSNLIVKAQKLSYGTGFFIGQIFVVPFMDGLMDSIEPQVKKRLTSIPTWVDTMMRSIFR